MVSRYASRTEVAIVHVTNSSEMLGINQVTSIIKKLNFHNGRNSSLANLKSTIYCNFTGFVDI